MENVIIFIVPYYCCFIYDIMVNMNGNIAFKR